MSQRVGPELPPSMQSLVDWIQAETGLSFPAVHHDTIRKTAERRCVELGLDPASFEALLRSDGAERTGFLGEIMIGETYFFRDEKQFSILIADLLPGLLREGRPLRLWSATCATGEEAVSLVAAVEEARRAFGLEVEYEVLATDINANALARLAAGRFPSSSFRNDGRSLHALLEGCGTMEGSEWQASAACLARIRPLHLNLLSGELAEPESVDLVFFRNTLVYMQQEQKDRMISRIASTLRAGGHLFLASPEVPSIRHPLLKVVESGGGFFFRKLAMEEAGPSAKRPSAGASGRREIVAARGAGAGRAEDGPRADRADTGRSRPSSARRTRPSSIGAAGLKRGLELASAWAADPASHDEAGADPAAREVALMIEAAIEALHANRFSEADILLARFETRAGENHVSQYLRALSLKHQGREAEALELWERARIFEAGFWPAHFQAALAYREAKPERSLALLVECLAALESGRDEGRYFVLLDGFDEAYYRRMAQKMLARLESGTTMEEPWRYPRQNT
jgi:chemotaxis protein methyltransferase CheR